MVQPVTFPSPGFAGLNKQQQQGVIGPEWATVANNCVVDAAGRIAARKGWSQQTVTPVVGAPDLTAGFEWTDFNGDRGLIFAAPTAFYESPDGGVTLNDVTSIFAVPTAGNWQFVNFQNTLFAVQEGHAILRKGVIGTGAMVLFGASGIGTLPVNPVAALAGFGRLWCVEEDRQTIKYSALLDYTLWDESEGGGFLDMSSVWTSGHDEVQAIAGFGAALVVFGRKHIIIFVDGQGSELAIDPTTMYVTDTVEGVGTVARDSVQNIGEGDLIFLSTNGIRSLARVLQDKQTPINDITEASRNHFIERLLREDIDQAKVRSVYSPEEGFYLLCSPDSGRAVCVDVRLPNVYRLTEWPDFTPTAVLRLHHGAVLFGFPGVVGKYEGYLDNEDSYQFYFQTGWLNLGEENEFNKIFKRIKLIIFSPGGVAATIKWFYDFQSSLDQETITFTGDSVSEYGTGEWGISEFGGGASQRIIYIPMSGSGQYVRVGILSNIDGAAFALQSATLFYQKGRFA